MIRSIRVNRSLIRFRNPDSALLRLFCLPNAGGSAAAFASWGKNLGAKIDVIAIEYPGRGVRVRDPLPVDMNQLVTSTLVDLRPYLTEPFAIFGHSMGALVGYEIVRRLESEDHLHPFALIVSAHRAPHLSRTRPPRHLLSDAELLKEIADLNGTPPEVISNAELMEILLISLRQDLRVCETYRHQGSRLSCSILAFGGIADREVSHDDLVAWSNQTTAEFQIRMFPGGHFFLRENEHLVLRAISSIGHHWISGRNIEQPS